MPVSELTKQAVMILVDKIIKGETTQDIRDVITLINSELP